MHSSSARYEVASHASLWEHDVEPLGSPLSISWKEWPDMGLRLLFIAAIFFALTPEAFAGESGGIFHRASCTVVRYYVAKYSEAAAEAWARSKGASESEIAAAHHCLDTSPAATVRTAKN